VTRVKPESYEEVLIYTFGHLVASHGTDAHAADSGELAEDLMAEGDMESGQRIVLRTLAEHVAGNYQYTGEAEDLQRRMERGEV
jgi:hypothetical protein